jgi:predicted glycoside hydrolase/deacetylase ChbG (UPF0249 family)
MRRKAWTNQLLGYPPEARLLIINADDFGMCHSINAATILSLREGLTSSCSLMVPCPWNLHAMRFLRENPDIAFGVHLTAICEHPIYRWKPISSPEKVPSLVGDGGYFHDLGSIDKFIPQVDLDEIETEFRAQIEVVQAAGLKPTHLDSHCHVHTRREAIFERVLKMAFDYGLAVRAHTQPVIERLRRESLPCNDHDVLDSYHIDSPHLAKGDKLYCYQQLLRELPPGLSEWAIHPGIESGELKAMEATWEVRKADFDFLVSPEAEKVTREEDVVILNYRPLQKYWQTHRKSRHL